MTHNSQLNELEAYLPSSSEKKQAVMMYMVVGLILSMWKREVSPYTHHHLKQSLGWLVFLVLVVFADFVLVILGIILSFFLWIAVLISIPALAVGIMGIYQAQQGKYIREHEMINKFFLFFSWIGNRVLNLFDANRYQIIDQERYRSEDQFYIKMNETRKKKSDSNQKIDTTQEVNENLVHDSDLLNTQNHEINQNTESVNQSLNWVNIDNVNTKSLDNDQQISINDLEIWIDLSDHEINNPEKPV